MPDQRRESERYQHQGLGEQIADELRGLRRHPRVLLLIGLIVGGAIVVEMLQPPIVTLEGLAVGDCIYIPTSTSGMVAEQRAIGTPSEATGGLVQAGAERAPCDASHSHEVAAVFTLPDAAGAPYPGGGLLDARQQAACEAAFATYVGRPVSGSRYDLTVVTPTQTAWDKGRRAGACLVSNADGTFLSSRAGGSGG